MEHVACFKEIKEVFDPEWEVFLASCVGVFLKAMGEILGGSREVSLGVGDINDCEPPESMEKFLVLKNKRSNLLKEKSPSSIKAKRIVRRVWSAGCTVEIGKRSGKCRPLGPPAGKTSAER